MRRASIGIVTALAMGVAPGVADAACKTYKHRAKVESDPFGTDLAYLNIKLRACFSGVSITKVSSLDITPTVTNNSLKTMKFEGVSPDPIREYRTWHKRRKGSYYVKAGGNWTQQAAGFEGRTDYVWASMRIFGNGKVDKDRMNG